jgi:lipopolysaccharide biosynthesis glycosyltransferase
MSEKVLVAMANDRFVDQAKELFSSAYWNAGWDGDYLLLAYDFSDDDASWFRAKGIEVLPVKNILEGDYSLGERIACCKAYVFTEYFKKWRNVVYLDVDIIIRAPFNEMGTVTGFCACPSLGQTVRDNFIEFDRLGDDVKNRIERICDLNKKSFNSGVLAFSTDIINAKTFDDCVEYINAYIDVSRFGGDQLAMNLFFPDWKSLPPVYNFTLPLDYPVNPNKIDAIILHLVSFGDGPWNPNSPFRQEWLEILARAEQIDLANIPHREPWSQKRINQSSRTLVKKHLLHGQELSVRSIRNMLYRFAILAFTDPKKLIVKTKHLFLKS